MRLRHRIEVYLRRTRTSPTRLGRLALGDKAFVFRLRNGSEPRDKTIARVTAWLDKAESEA